MNFGQYLHAFFPVEIGFILPNSFGGEIRLPVFPVTFTCMLRGTPCYTGLTRTFYREKICSVLLLEVTFFSFVQQKTKRQRPHKKVFQTLKKKHGKKRLRGKTHTSLYSAFTPSKSEN